MGEGEGRRAEPVYPTGFALRLVCLAMTERENTVLADALMQVLELVRLAARLLGAGGAIPRRARREVRLALASGEALYRRAVLLMALDMVEEMAPGATSPPSSSPLAGGRASFSAGKEDSSPGKGEVGRGSGRVLEIRKDSAARIPPVPAQAGTHGSESQTGALAARARPGSLPAQGLTETRTRLKPVRPRPLALTERVPGFTPPRPYTGPRGPLDPSAPVDPGPLAARLDRLRNALADPVAHARRLARWLIRRRWPGRQSPFRPGWPPGRRKGKAHGLLNHVLSEIDRLARAALAGLPSVAVPDQGVRDRSNS